MKTSATYFGLAVGP